MGHNDELSPVLQRMLLAAEQAWPSWNDSGVIKRGELLLRWANNLTQHTTCGSLASATVRYQQQRALSLLADELPLPGPTGETNVLYSCGRGVFVLSAAEQEPLTEHDNDTMLAIIALASVALLAGNSLLLVLPPRLAALQRQLFVTLSAAGVPGPVVHSLDYATLPTLVCQLPIAGVAYVGDLHGGQQLARQLADRGGMLVPLITALNGQVLTAVSDEHLLLRFIHERTCTVNITAMGGNTSLLAQGARDN